MVTVMKRVNRRGRFSIACLLALVLPAQASHLPLFDDHAVLDVTLSGPVERVIEDKSGSEEHDFTLSIDGREQDLEIRIRGQSRIELCDFPPLRLDFPRKRNDEGVFAGQNKLKLVTHCSSSGRSQESMLREYLAYRMLNLLTEASYDVRLLRITYAETERRGSSREPRYAFVVESAENLAHRIGGAPMETSGVAKPLLDQQQLATVNLFQYLIGNVDWSLAAAVAGEACCHNGDLFYIKGRYVVVPYDFDLSLLVDARYDMANSSKRLQTLRYRKHVGYCMDRDTLEAALEDIVAKREAMMAVIESLPEVDQGQLKRTVKFLDEFFEEADKESKFLKRFERDCL